MQESDRPSLYTPQPGPQFEFHTRIEDVVGYGGTKGPGKTQGILGEATRQIAHPFYVGAIFRRTYPQLQDIIDRAHRMYPQLGGKWNGQEHSYTFPKGSKIYFFHCQHEKDVENHNGKEYQFIGIDQVEQFTEYMVNYLLMQNRTSHEGLRCYARLTFNPGGIGHAWVKNMFIKEKVSTGGGQHVINVKIPGQTYTKEFVLPDGTKVTRTYCFIKGNVYDNKILLKHNPQYLAVLAALPEKLRKAYMDGNFDVFEGQYFDTWNEQTHVIKPFPIPKEWNGYLSFDWGFEKPLSCHWWAVPPGMEHVYCVYEYYVTRKLARTAGAEIHEISKKLFGEQYISQRKIECAYVDPSIFETEATSGKSIADDLKEAWTEDPEAERPKRLLILPADNDRIQGWNTMRNSLELQSDGKPFAQWFQNCIHAIETIPSLVHDEHRVEDLDTDGEDHAADENRYFLHSRFKDRKFEKKPPYQNLAEKDLGSFREWEHVNKNVLRTGRKENPARVIARIGT